MNKILEVIRDVENPSRSLLLPVGKEEDWTNWTRFPSQARFRVSGTGPDDSVLTHESAPGRLSVGTELGKALLEASLVVRPHNASEAVFVSGRDGVGVLEHLIAQGALTLDDIVDTADPQSWE